MSAVSAARRQRVGRVVLVCGLAAVSAASFGLLATLAACEPATNLDVSYGDASSPLETGPAHDGGQASDAAEAGAVGRAPGISGCPCDSTQGLGCCMPAAGGPFCTENTAACVNRMGTLLRCVGPDPSTESACCWHGSGAGAVTALAAKCDGGPTACSVDTDCAGSGETRCALAVCFGGTIAIGACGSVPPTCPQP